MMHDAKGFRDGTPEAGEASPALEVRGLTVEFPNRRGTLTAVEGVSLSIAPGEVLGVVGESGAGKSMTGLAVLGLLEPPGRIAAGEILIGGRRVPKLTQIDGSMPRLNAIPPGCSFNPRCPQAGPRCRRERPALAAVGAGHSACWLEQEGVE
ncbi:MAG: ATP-binding cassette domain-containing protein [Thermohalobaculum sp.]|nr:ATP-binding cassette domain-containing protein [Thermohalobaculum sp.]